MCIRDRFAKLVVASASTASIYGGAAIVLILMFWLYISWLVLLLGSSLAYYAQHPFQLRYGQRTEPIDNEALLASDVNLLVLAALEGQVEAFDAVYGPLARDRRSFNVPAREGNLADLLDFLARPRGAES